MFNINFNGYLIEENYWISKLSATNVIDTIQNCDQETFLHFDSNLENDYSKFSVVKCFKNKAFALAKRDIFGSVPLYFLWKKNDYVIFSDKLSDLVLRPNNELNHERITYYLNNQNLDSICKSHLTFYKDIYQVPAGSVVKVSCDEIQIKFVPYFHNFNKGKILEELKEKLRNVTKDCKKVAFQVSGGLDSTSLASIQAELPDALQRSHFCVASTDLKSCDESNFQEEFKKKYFTDIQTYSTKGNLFELTKAYCDIFLHPPLFFNTISLFENTLKELHNLKINKLVSGYGGDVVIGHGYEYIRELKNLKKYEEIRNFVTLAIFGDLLKSNNDKWETYSLKKKYNLTLEAFVFPLNKTNFRSIGIYLSDFKKAGGSYSFLVNKLVKWLFRFEKKIKVIEDSFSSLDSDVTYEKYYGEDFTNVRNFNLSNYNETFSNLGILFGVDFIFPFLSSRVLAASNAYNLEEKFGGGKGRNHFREEMKGVLPELIRNRIGKTSFDEYFVNEINLYLNQVGEIPDFHPLWAYIKLSDFKYYKNHLKNPEYSYIKKRKAAHFLHKVLNLKVWLDAVNLNLSNEQS